MNAEILSIIGRVCAICGIITGSLILLVGLIYWFELDSLMLRALEPVFRALTKFRQ